MQCNQDLCDVIAAPLSHYQARCRILRHLEFVYQCECVCLGHIKVNYSGKMSLFMAA